MSERCDCCEQPWPRVTVYESPHGDVALCEDCELWLVADVIELSQRGALMRRFQRVRQKQKQEQAA